MPKAGSLASARDQPRLTRGTTSKGRFTHGREAGKIAEKGWGRGRAGARAQKGHLAPCGVATPAFSDARTFKCRETNRSARSNRAMPAREGAASPRRSSNVRPPRRVCTDAVSLQRGGALFVVQCGRAGLSHALPGEGRRVLAAYSSAAPGSLGHPSSRPSLGRGPASRTAVPDPSTRRLDAIRGGADAVAPPLPIDRGEPAQRADLAVSAGTLNRGRL
jgi:hypothetical protein